MASENTKLPSISLIYCATFLVAWITGLYYLAYSQEVEMSEADPDVELIKRAEHAEGYSQGIRDGTHP